jgi:hypothetical protein
MRSLLTFAMAGGGPIGQRRLPVCKCWIFDEKMQWAAAGSGSRVALQRVDGLVPGCAMTMTEPSETMIRRAVKEGVYSM